MKTSSTLFLLGLVSIFSFNVQAQSPLELNPTIDCQLGIGSSALGNWANANGLFFFKANDAATGTEIWRTDGTVAGTSILIDYEPGAATPTMGKLGWINNTALFGAVSGGSTCILYGSDGTLAGTVPIDTCPGVPTNFYMFSGVTFFNAGINLWKTDGTNAGTVLVYSGVIPLMTEMGGMYYFMSADQLWKTDGTTAGTSMILDLYAASGTSTQIITANNDLYILASDGTFGGGTDIWKSDGTAAGTVMAVDYSGTDLPNGLVYYNGDAYYNMAADASLWKTDGTPPVNVVTSLSTAPVVYNGELYYGKSSGDLYKYNGSSETLVKDIYVSGATSAFYKPLVVCNTLFFAALDGQSSYYQIWQSDGTNSGTHYAYSVTDTLTSYYPFDLHEVNSTLIFQHQQHPWALPIDCTVGIDAEKEGIDINVYPNPSSDFVYVELPENSHGSIELVNLQGNIIESMSIQNQLSMFNITGLANGVYLIKVTTNNGMAIQKIIKE